MPNIYPVRQVDAEDPSLYPVQFSTHEPTPPPPSGNTLLWSAGNGLLWSDGNSLNWS